MKKVVFIISVLLIQSVHAQVIEYNGRYYHKSACTIQDSVLSFFPVDEAKVTAAGGVQAGSIHVPVSNPNYHKDWKVFDPRYITDPYLTIKDVEVEDTARMQKQIDEKRSYVQFRLNVVQAVKKQIEAIRAKKGQTLTDEKDIFIYNILMKRYGDEKDLKKLKVNKKCLEGSTYYLKDLEQEESFLEKFLNLTDRAEILNTTIPRDKVTKDGAELAHGLGILAPYSMANTDIAYNYARYTGELYTKKIDITFKNPLLADIPVTIFNPWYEGVGAEEWRWLQDIDRKGGLEHIVTSFPKEENYYKSAKYPDYRFYYNDNRHPYAVDKDGNLIGISVDDSFAAEGATMLYDFEHNVYNIKSESSGVQRWAYYLINKKLGKNTEPNFEKDAMGMMLGIGSIAHEMEVLNRLYAYRQITKGEYNRKMSELNAKAKTTGKKNDAALKKYPSKEEMERAEKFVNQLESDYNKSKLFSKTHVERLNGIQFMLVSDDRKLKVLKTYSIDSKGELTASYVTLEKN
ncbi:MAG: hypothetical protein J5720_04260 [Bacteroidaceae bacterium]|nr:hypothetical protein [Bacteroidaceae bacterium]